MTEIYPIKTQNYVFCPAKMAKPMLIIIKSPAYDTNILRS